MFTGLLISYSINDEHGKGGLKYDLKEAISVITCRVKDCKKKDGSDEDYLHVDSQLT